MNFRQKELFSSIPFSLSYHKPEIGIDSLKDQLHFDRVATTMLVTRIAGGK